MHTQKCVAVGQVKMHHIDIRVRFFQGIIHGEAKLIELFPVPLGKCLDIFRVAFDEVDEPVVVNGEIKILRGGEDLLKVLFFLNKIGVNLFVIS